MWSSRYRRQLCHLLNRKRHHFYTCYSQPWNNISWNIFVCFMHVRCCSVQGLFFFSVVCFSNNYSISWRGRCPCPLVHCPSDKCSELPEGIVPASSFPAMLAATSIRVVWAELLEGDWSLFSFFFFFLPSVEKQFCSFTNELQTIPRYQMSL